MKRKDLLSMCLCLLAFASGGQAKSVSTRINLGDTPWKFTKVVRQEINLAKDAQVCLDGKSVPVVHDGDIHSDWKLGDAPEGGIWSVDLGKSVSLSSVKLWFDTDRTRFAEVKLEVSADGSTWQTLSEGKKLCVLHKEGDFTTVGHTGTVGYTETVTATYLNLKVKGTARYVRFSGLKCKAEQGQDVPVTLSEVEVNPKAGQDYEQAGAMASLSFDDTGWQTVGIPHCYNEQDKGEAAGSCDPCGECIAFRSGHYALFALWKREPDCGKGVQCRGHVFHLARFRDQRRLRSGHGRYRLPRLPAQEEQGAHSF